MLNKEVQIGMKVKQNSHLGGELIAVVRKALDNPDGFKASQWFEVEIVRADPHEQFFVGQVKKWMSGDFEQAQNAQTLEVLNE